MGQELGKLLYGRDLDRFCDGTDLQTLAGNPSERLLPEFLRQTPFGDDDSENAAFMVSAGQLGDRIFGGERIVKLIRML